MMKLLLIEDDIKACDNFRKIANSMGDIEFVGITDSDIEGIKCVKENSPDAIILDLELNSGTGNGSGFEFLKELKKLKLPVNPKIVVTTNVYSDSVYDYLHSNKVDFIFYKKQAKYSEQNVINTLLILKDYKENEQVNPEMAINTDQDYMQKVCEKIDEALDLIGVGTHLQGRKYLHEAIKYLIQNENNNEKTPIIQYLSNTYKRPNSTISRAMQNAILYAWRISPIEDLTTYYIAKINYETGVPTPTEFIYYYVSKIKKEL